MNNIEKGLIVGGLVAIGGLVLYSLKKNKKVEKADYEIDEYIIDQFVDAKEVFDLLNEWGYKYGVVSLGDYYDTLGEVPDHKDFGYGWSAEEINKAKIVRVKNGWAIKFPPIGVLQ